jgi:hypothetical protein
MKRYTKASPPTESIRAAKSMSAPDSIVTKTPPPPPPPPPRHRTDWYVAPDELRRLPPARHQVANGDGYLNTPIGGLGLRGEAGQAKALFTQVPRRGFLGS